MRTILGMAQWPACHDSGTGEQNVSGIYVWLQD